ISRGEPGGDVPLRRVGALAEALAVERDGQRPSRPLDDQPDALVGVDLSGVAEAAAELHLAGGQAGVGEGRGQHEAAARGAGLILPGSTEADAVRVRGETSSDVATTKGRATRRAASSWGFRPRRPLTPRPAPRRSKTPPDRRPPAPARARRP